MKRFFFFILFLIPSLIFSQDNDSLKKDTSRFGGIFISSGINIIHYYSNSFFTYLTSNITFSHPKTSYYGSTSGSSTPTIFLWNKFSYSPIFNSGIELISKEQRKIHHLFEVSFMQYSGNYSGAAESSESGTIAETAYSNIYHDTINSKFLLSSISLGYKFQPNFKYFFLTIGGNVSLNLIKIEQHQIQHEDGSWNDVGNGTHGTFSKQNSSDTSYHVNFINLPLTLGVGKNFYLGKFTLRTSCYFMPFIRGYNFYTASLAIMCNYKKKKCQK